MTGEGGRWKEARRRATSRTRRGALPCLGHHSRGSPTARASTPRSRLAHVLEIVMSSPHFRIWVDGLTEYREIMFVFTLNATILPFSYGFLMLNDAFPWPDAVTARAAPPNISKQYKHYSWWTPQSGEGTASVQTQRGTTTLPGRKGRVHDAATHPWHAQTRASGKPLSL